MVGIARDAKYGAFNERAEPYVYFPVAQRPAPTAGMTLVVRTRGDADALAAALRREVRAMDPALPVYRAQTMRAIVGEGARLALAGLGAGLLLALAAGRLVSSMLVEVGAADALTLVGVSLVLLAASILASWLPARRAARVDPMVALRSE